MWKIHSDIAFTAIDRVSLGFSRRMVGSISLKSERKHTRECNQYSYPLECSCTRVVCLSTAETPSFPYTHDTNRNVSFNHSPVCRFQWTRSNVGIMCLDMRSTLGRVDNKLAFTNFVKLKVKVASPAAITVHSRHHMARIQCGLRLPPPHPHNKLGSAHFWLFFIRIIFYHDQAI